MPNPFTLLQLIEASLTLSGRCYLFRERNIARGKTLRYVLPSSVKPVIDPIKGLTGFKRPVNGITRQFKTEEFVHFWLPDPYVEIGEPINFPGIAANNACGVLLNVDVFASNFFGRGAIKAMFAAVKGMPVETERLKFKDRGFRPPAGGALRPGRSRDPPCRRGIVRNRVKIESAIANARALLDVAGEFGSFDAYLWRFVDGAPIRNAWGSLAELPAATAESRAMSKDLLRRGFRFRRADHLLRLDAGSGHGQRPHGRLLPPRRTRWKAMLTACAPGSRPGF